VESGPLINKKEDNIGFGPSWVIFWAWALVQTETTEREAHVKVDLRFF